MSSNRKRFQLVPLAGTSMLEKMMSEAGQTVAHKGELGESDLFALRLGIDERLKTLDQKLIDDKFNPEVRRYLEKWIEEQVMEEAKNLSHISARMMKSALKEVAQRIANEVLGFGVIQPYLDDPEVTEIMVNGSGPRSIFLEKKGRLYETDLYYESDKDVQNVIERIVSPLGRRIDESSPMVDARLPDGSRVNAIIPPLALNGPSLTIRKFTKGLTVEELIRFGAFTEQDAELLEAMMKSRLNIVVSGGTGSGKTTVLNTLCRFIPHNERIITIEDSAELDIEQPHVVRLETKPANLEGKGAITMRDLVINALRMRPDRIIPGEVRGPETYDMLNALNTGHIGYTTVHSNGPKQTITRLETMTLMAVDMPARAIREMIVAGIHVIIHTSRIRDGSRKITHISEIQGIHKDGEIVLKDIMSYDHQKGRMVPTGVLPRFLDMMDLEGITPPAWLIKEAV